MEEILEFDDELSRVVETFNGSPGAMERRRRISLALAPQPGESILDVGSGPGNQAYELSPLVSPGGAIEGVDPAESAIAISSRRCSGLTNTKFKIGDAEQLPYADSAFDAVMSSQVFEYLENVIGGLQETAFHGAAV